MKYSIIIPTFNNLECVVALCKSIIPRENMEVIFVSNGSTDGTEQYLEGKYRCIKLDKNYGWCCGINEGLREAKGDYIVFCNDDVIFPAVNWLDEMASAMDIARNTLNKPIGICGPRSNYVRGRQLLQFEPAQLNDINKQLQRQPEFVETDFISGFCMMVSRECLDKLGGLDESFSPGGYDDNDYCMRAQEAGFGLIISLRTAIYHKGSVTLNREYPSSWCGQSNRSKFINKWKSKLLEKKAPECVNLSLAMIMKDEAENIDEFFAGVWPYVSEIKILDTGSTDNSVEVASVYGEVVKLETDDLSVARNEIEKYCNCDWVLTLDFDEAIQGGPLDWRIIRKLIQDKFVDAYKLHLINVFPGGQQVPQVNLRLYRKGSGKWTGSVHETFEVAEGKIVEEMGMPSIYHYGYLKPGKTSANDIYAQRIINELREHPESGFHWFQKALIHIQRGQDIEAEKCLVKAINYDYSPANHSLGFLYLTRAAKAFGRSMEVGPDRIQGVIAAKILKLLEQAFDLEGTVE